MSSLLVAILAGLGGMLGWGFADFFAKKTIDVIGDVQSLAWAGVFGTVAFIPALFYQSSALHIPFSLPSGIEQWFWIALFGVLQAAVYLFAYNGFAKGQVAVLNPIFSSFAGWVALISILFLGETVSVSRIASLIIIFLGVMFVSVDFQALRERRSAFASMPGLSQIIIATILASIWTLGWDRIVSNQDAVMYAFLMFLFMSIFVFLFAFARRLNLKVPRGKIWVFIALIGICETVAYLAITVGYSATIYTSVVALISGAFSVPTIILARLFLKEHPLRMQTIGSIIIVLGVALLSLI
jgi:drug/metabolite transporter (DMT)-like permease